VGTDYNPKGIPGIGQKKALELVKRLKQPIFIFKEVEERIMSLPEEDRFDWKEIFELFHKPNIKDEEIKFPGINKDKIKEILVNEHDFSQERVEKQIQKLEEVENKAKQKGLDDWF
ncbi:MAG: flap structure-specific endonuclease, partial [Nanoarchaeota archaeon]